MEKTSPFTAFYLGIIIVVLGSLLPENQNYDYNIMVMILGAIILLISILMFIKDRKNKNNL